MPFQNRSCELSFGSVFHPGLELPIDGFEGVLASATVFDENMEVPLTDVFFTIAELRSRTGLADS
jgi:hypothetical protein